MAKVLDLSFRPVLPLPLADLKKPIRKFAKRDTSKYGKRHKPGEMNRTETEYAGMLEARRITGEIEQWQFESMTFKLADDCRYSPDFMVYKSDGTMEFIDAKGAGPIDPKSMVKLRCAADKFPMFTFAIEQKQSKKQGGSWKRQEF